MNNKPTKFNSTQKIKLLNNAKSVIAEFEKCVILEGDVHPHDLGDFGVSFFDGYMARLSEDFINSRREFVELACKMLKARSAHEKTIRTFCQKSGQEYVKLISKHPENPLISLEEAATKLTETVLSEAGREYIHIEPNFLIKHTVTDVINIGRVRSMPTDLAETAVPLPNNKKFQLEIGNYPEQTFSNGIMKICMPSSIWVVDVPATRENVAEEAKWLIDVAVSFIRIGTSQRPAHFPRIGQIEAHPTYPTYSFKPHVTIEGSTLFTGGGHLCGWYEINKDIISELSTPELKARAKILFDPEKNSLAQRVSQGLGWMTRGRQVSDRAERLLAFFTALEALLSSDDKSSPITQTISRHISVILTQDINSRVSIYNQIKGLYALRSAVVHAGKREVLWQDVNNLQIYTETTYWIVLNKCDLNMHQDKFSQSLIDASHGMPWEFADPPTNDKS